MNPFTRTVGAKFVINYTPSSYLEDSEDQSNSSSSDYETSSESSEGDKVASRKTSYKLPLRGAHPPSSSPFSSSPPSSNNYKGTQYDFSITSKMRGMWFKIILDAVGADEGDKAEKIVYLRQFRRLQQHFPCSMCKQHFGEYILLHPPEQVMNLKEGFFDYVVEFMNSINRRIGKEEYDRDVLRGMFPTSTSTSSISCTKDCGIERVSASKISSPKNLSSRGGKSR